MNLSAQIGEQLHKMRVELGALFAEYRGEDGVLNMPAEKVAEARKRNDAITEKAKEYEAAKDVESMFDENAAGIEQLSAPQRPRVAIDDIEQPTFSNRPGTKSLGQLFIESDEFKASRGLAANQVGPALEVDLEKLYGKGVAARGIHATIFDTATSYVPQSVRLPDPITPGEETPRVADLMPQGRTSQPAVPYMEETTTTPAAAETAESGSKPEAALVFTEKTSAVRKIAVQLPITDEALEDVPLIESYVDTRLRTFAQQREDQQLLVGNGTPPNLRGILNTSGIQTQAKGADATPDAIFKGMQKVRSVGFLEPTGVVLHPDNWTPIRLLRTADGIYIWGNPSEAGPERIFGATVVQTTYETAGTGLVGAFRDGAEIFRRSDLSLQVGFINDQFIKNQRTLLVEERLALVVFRPKAFCTITGLP